MLDVALEHQRGHLVYRDVWVSVPRQAGKSTLVLVLILYRLLAAPCHAVYGAQTRLAARQKLLDDWWPMLRRSPLSKLFDVSRATGQEALHALGGTGSRCRVVSSDEHGVHGATVSVRIGMCLLVSRAKSGSDRRHARQTGRKAHGDLRSRIPVE